ncbi:MAG: sigma-70 family RNA polymerase sigma factor [Myxococcota bacterium]
MSEAATARAVRESAVREALGREDVAGATSQTLELYGYELFRFLRATLRDEARAEDAYQELCIQIFRALPRFEWRSSLRTWAFRLARHTLGRAHRSARHREAQLGTAEESALVARWTRTVTAEWRRTAARDRLRERTAALPEEDRSIVTLRIRDRMSWKEIARILGPEDAPDEAVATEAARLRKRYERIKAQLREELA